MTVPPYLVEALQAILAEVMPVPMRRFRQPLPVEAKADESPVTVADRETETAIRDAIAARFPDHGIFGEEFGGPARAGEWLWVIDPIDGTKSFVSGNPLWGILVGLLHRDRPILGAVAIPALGHVAWGAPQLGARLDGRAVSVRSCPDPAGAFVLCNELRRILAADPAVPEALGGAVRYLREASDCFSYVQLAAGWVDGVVDHGLEPYDFLPVLPLVEAAGGVMTDWQGRPLSFESDGRVVAGSPEVHAHLLNVISATGAAGD
ncbi:MAG: inositol monophosphatase family protein [Gemmobacter sp.]